MNSQQYQKNELCVGAKVQLIQNSDLLACCDDNLLFSSKRSIISLDLSSQTLKSCLIDDEKIISVAYHAPLEVYFVSTDKLLVVVNKDGEIVAKQKIPQLLQAQYILILPMEDGYEAASEPNTRHDHLLFTTSEYLYLVKISLKYERSLLKSKNLCNLSVEFLQPPTIILYEWIALANYLPRINMLVCWNKSEVYVFDAPLKSRDSLALAYTYDKIMRKTKLYETENKVNHFEISLKHRLLLAAFQLGAIKVYKLDETKKYVCELRGHQRQCTSLFIPSQTPDLLYSSGLDNSIRIWDLIDLTQVYLIRIDTICSTVIMLSEKLVFARSNDKRKTYIIRLNVNLLLPILSEQKSGTIININSDGEWIVALFSNNLAETYLLPDNEETSRQFNEKFQFPHKYGFLRSSIKLKNELFAICVEKGFSVIKLNKDEAKQENFQLKRLVYNHSLNTDSPEKGRFIEMIHEKLLDTYFFTMLEDWKNIPLAINVTSVSLLINAAVPKWDIENQAKLGSMAREDYAILGSDRGYIYFINIKRRSHYHTRVHFHSCHVSNVSQIFLQPLNSLQSKAEQNQLDFISITDSNEMALWSLSYFHPPKLKFRIKYTRQIALIRTFEKYLAIGSRSGQFNVFEMQRKGTDEVTFFESAVNREEGHFKAVVSIDYIQYNGKDVFLTAGEDRAIKLWKGIEKQLLLEIKMFNAVNEAIFVKKNISLVICHGENNQLSLLTAKLIPEMQEALKKCDHDTGMDSKQEINLRSFLCPAVEHLSQIIKKVHEESDAVEGHRSHGKEELLKSRIINQFELTAPVTEKKRMGKRKNQKEEQSQVLSSNNSFLPKISGRVYHKDSIGVAQFSAKMPQSSGILEKVKSSRGKSYSQAGRYNY